MGREGCSTELVREASETVRFEQRVEGDEGKPRAYLWESILDRGKVRSGVGAFLEQSRRKARGAEAEWVRNGAIGDEVKKGIWLKGGWVGTDLVREVLD